MKLSLGVRLPQGDNLRLALRAEVTEELPANPGAIS